MYLTDFPNDYSYIKIQPAYKFQGEGGEEVRTKDFVLLEIFLPVFNKPAFLNVSQKILQKQEFFDFQEINASIDKKTKWKIIFHAFANNSNKKKILEFDDYFWISHSGSNSILISKNDLDQKITFSKD